MRIQNRIWLGCTAIDVAKELLRRLPEIAMIFILLSIVRIISNFYLSHLSEQAAMSLP